MINSTESQRRTTTKRLRSRTPTAQRFKRLQGNGRHRPRLGGHSRIALPPPRLSSVLEMSDCETAHQHGTNGASKSTTQSHPSDSPIHVELHRHSKSQQVTELQSSELFGSEEQQSRKPQKFNMPSLFDDEAVGERNTGMDVQESDRQIDSQVCEGLTNIWSKIHSFVNEHFDFDLDSTDPETWQLAKRLLRENATLARIVDLMTVGGSAGEQGWQELILTANWRKRVIAGVIWRFLKEEVFHALMFGCSRRQERALKRLLWAKRNHDGFARQYDLALTVREWLVERRDMDGLPSEFVSRARDTTTELFAVLYPLNWIPPSHVADANLQKQLEALRKLVIKAAHLSLIFRLDPETIYGLPLTLKDDRFDAMKHIGVNEHQMCDANPLFTLQYDPSHGMDETKLQSEYTKSALVRVVLMDSCVAYRRGGWSLTEEHAEELRVAGERIVGKDWNGDPSEMGFRARKLAKAKVALRWGWQREFDVKPDEATGSGWKDLKDVLYSPVHY